MEVLVVISVVALFSAAGWVSRSSWFKGKVGERQVSSTLKRKLGKRDYLVLNDLVLPTKDHGTTQIDHLVVSRFGVFVIETKNMSGWIYGSEKSPEWTQVIYSWKSRFQNPLRQNYKHVKAVEHSLKLRPQQVHNVVVFVGRGEPRTEMPDNVIWGKSVLPYYIKTFLNELIHEEELADIRERLLGYSNELTR